MKIWKFIFWITISITILLALSAIFLTPRAGAATNINSTTAEHFAWDDVYGWWDFYSTNSVVVQGAQLTGYASSSAGIISFDCATSPSGNICGTSNYGICYGPSSHGVDGICPNGDAGDSGGKFTGYAWNDIIGWISFNCDQTDHGGANQCADHGGSDYWVILSGGDFTGYAWNDIVGWISFNCSNNVSCGTYDYKVATSYIPTSTVATVISDIIDTQVVDGATLNSLTWKGALNVNGKIGATYVDFQIAVSNASSGPWNFIGPSGTSADYYAASCAANYRGGVGNGALVDTPICIDPTQVINMRYIKYLVRLRSNLIQNDTPRVDDVILNWSK
ncbi:MAG: hypothetical protein WCV80_03370 [Candidatus Paceibacterota bacterium]|jgi:hypothetical protein